MPDSTDSLEQPDKLPPKIHYAYWFQGFNAASWQICLGSPMILFARSLGAPAVVLGLLAGLAPLTSVLQLLVARYAERIGYRNLMLRGWSTRVVILIFLVALPFATPYIGNSVAVTVLVLVMLVFTISRAIGVCSWLPWLALIVPKPLRGFYLSRDRTFISAATLAALAISGVVLLQPTLLGYAAVFLLGFIAGAVSLYFLNRIPEPPATPGMLSSPMPANNPGVSWLSLLNDSTFVRLMTFSVSVQVVIAASGAFTLVFVRERVGLGDGPILWLTAGASVLGLLALQLFRRRADRLGSKPLLAFTLGWWVIFFLSWLGLALNGAKAGAPGLALVAAGLLLMNGFFSSTYDLALTRLLMNVAGDRPASAQYFALHSVVVSIVTGLSPILWGLLLDNLRGAPLMLGSLSLSNYAVLFAAQWLLLGGVAIALARLKEANAQPFRRVAYNALLRAPAHLIVSMAPALARLIRRIP
jgi:MFS family permease